MTKYIVSGQTTKTYSDDAISVTDTLNVATYVVNFDQQTETYFLSKVDDLKMPKKLYGQSIDTRVNRIIDTFQVRSKSTGVLLRGEKGSGKSLLLTAVSRAAANIDIPTIMVQTPYNGAGFNAFMNGITTPSVVLFDEYEKVYSEEDNAQALLSLFDGMATSKHLYMLSVNGEVSEFLLNRPGRMYYNFNYEGLPNDLVKNYITDTLERKEHTETITNICESFTSLNFDMLQAIVEEVNRYNEDPMEIIKTLNASPLNESCSYKIDVVINGEVIDSIYLHTDSPYIDNNPLVVDPHFDIYGIRPSIIKKDRAHGIMSCKYFDQFTDDEIDVMQSDMKTICTRTLKSPSVKVSRVGKSIIFTQDKRNLSVFPKIETMDIVYTPITKTSMNHLF